MTGGLKGVTCGKDGFSLLEVITALAILGIAVVMLIQLFSMTLRTVRKSEDYSKALIYAGSLLEEAYAIEDVEEAAGSFDLGEGFGGDRTVALVSEDEGAKLFEIRVAVTWPPEGKLELTATRSEFETQSLP